MGLTPKFRLMATLVALSVIPTLFGCASSAPKPGPTQTGEKEKELVYPSGPSPVEEPTCSSPESAQPVNNVTYRPVTAANPAPNGAAPAMTSNYHQWYGEAKPGTAQWDFEGRELAMKCLELNLVGDTCADGQNPPCDGATQIDPPAWHPLAGTDFKLWVGPDQYGSVAFFVSRWHMKTFESKKADFLMSDNEFTRPRFQEKAPKGAPWPKQFKYAYRLVVHRRIADPNRIGDVDYDIWATIK